MAFDFTLTAFENILRAALDAGYKFDTFENFMNGKSNHEKLVLLRHDVDKKPYNSLATAKLENNLGIASSYYFRIVDSSNDPNVIKQIRDLGHEIGYHYEEMDLANGNTDEAVKIFEKNLAYFRTYYPVVTICMHGSPMSKFDNKDIWKKANYRDYGIIGEPYFDVDFSKFGYLTDTGRSWNGEKVSVRDKVKNSPYSFNLKTSFEVIEAFKANKLPPKIMITTHPQRWNNKLLPYITEFVMQKTKNFVKAIIVKKNSGK
ncbi:MAG: hypothetical protein JSS63_06900 [Bacteroidetes bacterium]|nr:hypothetical protein [Bacteroidota bacterium]